MSICGIAGKSQSMHFMSAATCSIVQQPLTHFMPTTELQENASLDLIYCLQMKLAQSFVKVFTFVLSECRQPGDPKGVQEAGSEAASGQERRRG